jgi:hypothetical protein
MSISFGMQHWNYQSFLVLPTDAEQAAPPGATITARTWAKGKLYLEDSVNLDLSAIGTLEIPTNEGLLKLAVKALLKETELSGAAKFEAVGQVQELKKIAKGACYALVGWAFPGLDGKVAKITGSIQAVRGPALQPDRELGGMPARTVGLFIASPLKQ